jgi:hypothetical protein
MEVDDWCCWNEEEEQIYLISHIWFWWESYLLVLKLLVVSDFCKVAGYEEKMCMKSFVSIEDGEKIGLS